VLEYTNSNNDNHDFRRNNPEAYRSTSTINTLSTHFGLIQTRMEKHPVHRIMDLVLLDNLKSTHNIYNKASGVQLNQEVVMLTQKTRSTCNGLMVKFRRISTNLVLLANL